MIKTDYIDPVRTSANWKPPKIAKLHRQGGPKLLHRRVGREKATVPVGNLIPLVREAESRNASAS